MVVLTTSDAQLVARYMRRIVPDPVDAARVARLIERLETPQEGTR